jgi:RNase P subunit RPR2
MTFRIELPITYTCSDCWWKMRYAYPAGFSVTDTTTWRAYIEGNPIHLTS